MTPESDSTQHELIDLTHVDFKKVVIDSKKAFVIQIQADWCGECFIMTSLFKQLAKEFSDQITFGYVNVETNEEITKQYGVTELPRGIAPSFNRIAFKKNLMPFCRKNDYPCCLLVMASCRGTLRQRNLFITPAP
jgi:thiol-disulfide isomerase/thioredoxin